MKVGWNSETGEFLGLTPKTWLKVYAVAAVVAACVIVAYFDYKWGLVALAGEAMVGFAFYEGLRKRGLLEPRVQFRFAVQDPIEAEFVRRGFQVAE